MACDVWKMDVFFGYWIRNLVASLKRGRSTFSEWALGGLYIVLEFAVFEKQA